MGYGERTIAGNGRVSQVLSQIATLMPAMTRGYFRLTSDLPVFSYSVFGKNDLSVMAAIPPQNSLIDDAANQWTDLGRILESADFGRPASSDGLLCLNSTLTGIPGGNPNVIVRADGTRLMYLSANDPVRGPGIRLVRFD